MSEITLNTGLQSDEITINLKWFNHNYVNRDDKLEVVILDKDKPRTMQIKLNGALLTEIEHND